MKNKIILRITGIGVLIAFVWMISSANMIYPQNSIDELEWAKKFFKAGSYQEAAELLKVFISKHKKSEPERLEEFSEAYYLLSKINFFLNKPDEMRDALQQLLRLTPDFEFSNTEEKEYLEKANGIKKLMAAQKYTDTAKEISKIHVSLSLINIERPGIILIEHKEKPEIKKSISFQDPKKISFELEKPGNYILTFIIDNNRAAMERRITKDLDIETSLSLSTGEEPVLDKAKITQQPENVIKVKEGTKKKKKKRTIIYVVVGLVVAGGATAALLLSKGGNGNGGEGSTVGSIQVNSTPSGAQIYLDGNDTGKTTNTTITDVSIGSHTVKLVKEGYLDYQDNINLSGGETETINATLNKHTIAVISPTNTTVWKKGEEIEIKWETDGSSNLLANAITTGPFPLQNMNNHLIQLSLRRRYLSHYIKSKDSEGNRLNKRSKFEARQTHTQNNSQTKSQGELNLRRFNSQEIPNRKKNPIKLNSVTGMNIQNMNSKPAKESKISILSNVKIDLFKAGNKVKTITNQTSNKGSFKWHVADTLKDGEDYKIRILFADDPSIFFESRNFEIVHSYKFIREWGTLGTDAGQFNQTNDVAVDSAGYVYVADGENHRIQKFTSGGTYLTEWGKRGAGPGEFWDPAGIAIDASGNNVFVADTNNHRVQKFTSSGTFLKDWAVPKGYPCGIAVDRNSRVYVSEAWGQRRILVFDLNGNLITNFGQYGSKGAGEFNQPYAIAVDNNRYIYVADTWNQRIQKFSPTYQYVTMWGSGGNKEGQFNEPRGIAADNSGHIFVVDWRNHRVQTFTKNGDFVGSWGEKGSNPGQFYFPKGIAVDRNGYIYVADWSNNRIQKFKPIGLN